jgi:hypothetical protein
MAYYRSGRRRANTSSQWGVPFSARILDPDDSSDKRNPFDIVVVPGNRAILERARAREIIGYRVRCHKSVFNRPDVQHRIHDLPGGSTVPLGEGVGAELFRP